LSEGCGLKLLSEGCGLTKDIPMSISSVPPSLVVKAPDPVQWKAPEPKTDNNADTRGVQPPVQAALPPGQGTRIDQLA
jgi:hypothetical protein